MFKIFDSQMINVVSMIYSACRPFRDHQSWILNWHWLHFRFLLFIHWVSYGDGVVALTIPWPGSRKNVRDVFLKVRPITVFSLPPAAPLAFFELTWITIRYILRRADWVMMVNEWMKWIDVQYLINWVSWNTSSCRKTGILIFIWMQNCWHFYFFPSSI